ncbi:hypothetical protein OZN62_04075 [Aurantiacibacter sp. MUD11]|uniref:hypothetical protein n=1 Tax=Aurantiacibacter sp. MUD11 TaxID=3003265 RepID=UPI0022AACD07|nr:hypothetical protein [Aurantiacibacter sp. MUD11]WAT18754.1 hypothetical protein OZN62_04075 [Aurantiacibacter sp. MUD11]
MLTTILLASALSGTALVEEADRRNLAYTECLFAQVRAAREARLPEEAMLARLESECRTKRLALEEITLAVRRERGDSRAEAQANWDRVHGNSIEAVRRAYALRLSEQQR